MARPTHPIVNAILCLGASLVALSFVGCADPEEEERESRPCSDIKQSYQELIESGSTCTADSECQILSGQCGNGLGGCSEHVNMSISQDDIFALGREHNEEGCTGPVCDCPLPTSAVCVEGRCEAAPSTSPCGGYALGETWKSDCNDCVCLEDGPTCTLIGCASN